MAFKFVPVKPWLQNQPHKSCLIYAATHKNVFAEAEPCFSTFCNNKIPDFLAMENASPFIKKKTKNESHFLEYASISNRIKSAFFTKSVCILS